MPLHEALIALEDSTIPRTYPLLTPVDMRGFSELAAWKSPEMRQ